MADNWRAQLPVGLRQRYVTTLETIEESAYRRARSQWEYEYIMDRTISCLRRHQVAEQERNQAISNIGARRSSADQRNRQQQQEPLAEIIQVPRRESVPQTSRGIPHRTYLFRLVRGSTQNSDQTFIQIIECSNSSEYGEGNTRYETSQSMNQIRERHYDALLLIYIMCNVLLNQELSVAYELALMRAVSTLYLIIRALFATSAMASREELDSFESYIEWIINQFL